MPLHEKILKAAAKRNRESEGQCPSGRSGRQPGVPDVLPAFPCKKFGEGGLI